MTRTSYDADVIVVGAGPAGGAAAYHLASRDHRVILLDRSVFPRDKACGDAVSRAGVGLLEEMGVLGELPQAHSVAGLSLSVGPHPTRTTRDLSYADQDSLPGRYALVVPRAVLDEAIVSRAAKAGAAFRERTHVRGLVRLDGKVAGVEIAARGGTETLTARVVVAADGATSTLARQAGLARTPRPPYGHAIRAYFQHAEPVTDALRIFMPLTHPATGVQLAAYGWIFPMGPRRLNVGVGVGELQPGIRLTELFELFLSELRTSIPAFTQARQITRLRGAPVNLDFVPQRTWAPGFLLAGEAAGLVNPTTGEGIRFALESGMMAARTIHAHLTTDGTSSLSDYADRLAHTFSGRLETGRHTATRHRLGWRVLQDTFDSDRPLFALTRRVVFAPDHSGLPTIDTLDDIRSCLAPGLRIGSQLAQVGEILADTARSDWPFLLRLHALASPAHIMAPRPALLMLLAARFGRPNRTHLTHLTALAAAADLTAIAAIAQTSVNASPGADRHAGRPNWGTMFAVLTADLLLARALELCTTTSAQLTALLTRTVEQACRGRMTELSAHHQQTPRPVSRWLEISAQTGLAALASAACELGARAAEAPEETVHTLAVYGRCLGSATQLSDDLRRLSGGTDRLGRDALADLEDATPSLPFRLALSLWGAEPDRHRALVDRSRPRHERAAEVSRLIAQTGALEQTRGWIRQLLDDARHALAPLPDGPARRSLQAIIERALHQAEAQVMARS